MGLNLDDKLLQQIRQYAEENLDNFEEECIHVCETPAPGLKEEKRAKYVQKRFEEIGWESYIDEIGNVIGVVPGNSSLKPNIMFAAHLDTVFPEGTDVSVTKKGNTLHAPGIRDNSAGVAGIIMLAKALREIAPNEFGNIYLVGTVGEEGLGDLRGMKVAYQNLKDSVDYCIAVDGGLGGMVHGGIASRRLKVSVKTGGGHSWGAFGVPSAIHALGRMIAGIDTISVPDNPKTTYNVGVIEGGTSINTIAATAVMLIDMRSIQDAPLHKLEEQVRQVIDTVAQQQDVAYNIEVVGDRPGGYLVKDHVLVETVDSILSYLKVKKYSGPSSTDANIPLSQGKPAVCVGVTTGRNGHRVDEVMDVPPLSKGLEQLVLLLHLL